MVAEYTIFSDRVEKRTFDSDGPGVVIGKETYAANPRTELKKICQGDYGLGIPTVVNLETDVGYVSTDYYLIIYCDNIVLNGKNHNLGDIRVYVSSIGSVVLKNLEWSNTGNGNSITVVAGDVDMMNCHVSIDSDTGQELGQFTSSSKRGSNIHVDRYCVFRVERCYYDIGIMCIGMDLASCPTYDKYMDVHDIDKAIEPYKVNLFFGGTLKVYSNIGGEETYGIYTNGSNSRTSANIYVNDGADIQVNLPKGIGVHQVSSGKLVLNGGSIEAGTGITFRGNFLEAPPNSTIYVRGEGNAVDYVPPENGIAGSGITLGNAIVIEAFRNGGYGAIATSAGGKYLTDKPVINIDGGTYRSEYSYAIGSYENRTVDTRSVKFVGSGAVLDGGRSGGGNPYDHGNNADYDIMK